MHTELRILNGLHRGGVLPLDETTLLIGANEDADVVLVDNGICDHHASLQPSDAGWMLSADQGSVFDTERASAQMLLDLQVGDFFRLGETWLVISDGAAAWQDIPRAVLKDFADDVFDDSQVDFSNSESQSINEAVLAAKITASDAAAQLNTTDVVADSITGSITDGVAEDTTAASAETRRLKLPRWRRWMIAPLSLFIMLGGVAAYAYTARPSLPKLLHPEIPIALRTDKSSTALPSDEHADRPEQREAVTSASPLLSPTSLRTSTSTPHGAAAASTPQALQAAFRKRMKDADLLQRFDLDLNDTAWSMRAHLDDAESARFEHILKAFVVEHKITFPISAKVGSAESMLPFQIRQIITGVNAGIVTGDGDRVYVGDELLGVKLVAVIDNHLTFMGKRKIEVIW